MTENKRFTKYVPDSYGYTHITTIIDNEKNKQTGNIDEIVDMLNELDEKYVDEFALRETLQQELQRVEEENKELKEHLSTWRSSCCNYINVYSILDNEVSILKETKDLDRFFEKFDKYSRMPFYEVEKSFIELQKENEQLNQRIKSKLHYYRELADEFDKDDGFNYNIVKRIVEDLEDILK